LRNYEEKLRFIIGDIRDKERLNRAMKDIDIIFHFAALKHVVACEYNPFEAIKTNILGIQNLIEISIDNDIEKFLFTSTDKAATPSNTMGVTKLLGEKLVTSANYYKGWAKTVFCSVRFGNVLGSRGSIIPLIEEQIKNDLPIYLTHRDMTRYVMDMNLVIELIFKSLEIAQGGEVFIPKMHSLKIIDLIEVLIEIFAKKYNKKGEGIQIKEIGIFSGEKLYEELFSIEESERTYQIDEIYMIEPQITELSNRIDFEKYPNIKKFDNNLPFNSNDGPFLSKEEIKEFLYKKNILL
jgi:FlaA1/EpsC-like NDP-sugar epimerase